METYDWIQILALVAVLVYSGWLASRKGTQKKGNGAPQMGRQEKDSPLYGPDADMPKPYPAVDTVQVEKGLEEDTYRAYQTVQSTDGAELLPSEGVAMISTQAGENQELVIGNAMSGLSINNTTGNGAVNPLPDLRTMVISSEILKPKYEEY